MKFVCPLIVVSDIENSKRFYTHILQQKVKYDFGENITFHGDFAIHLASHFKSLIDDRDITKGGNNFELYFEYDDVEQIVEILKQNNVTLIHDMREQPWRQRVVRFYDPDQHIIEIGESLEFLAFRLYKEEMEIAKIAETINLPVDFVSEAIKKFKNG